MPPHHKRKRSDAVVNYVNKKMGGTRNIPRTYKFGKHVVKGFYNNFVSHTSAKARMHRNMMRGWSQRPRSTSSKNNHNVIESIHGEIKRKHHEIKCSGTKNIPKSIGEFKIREINQFTIASNEGQQVVYYQGIATTNQFLTSSALSYNIQYQANQCLFDANPYQTNTGGGLYGTVVKPLDDRIVLKDIVRKYHLANQNALVPVTLEVYVIRQKCTTSSGPDAFWGTVLTSEALGISAATQQTINVAASSGVGNIYTLGMRPDSLASWRKYFQVVRKDTYDMAPGANIILTYNFKFGKMVEKAYLTKIQADGNLFVPGLTHHIMFIARGGIVKDTTSGTNTNQWSTCPTQIGCVMETDYYCSQPQTNRLKTNYQVVEINCSDPLANLKSASVVDAVYSATQA